MNTQNSTLLVTDEKLENKLSLHENSDETIDGYEENDDDKAEVYGGEGDEQFFIRGYN